MRPHLSEENHRELLAEASFKKKEEILELLARRFPKPDIPDSVRKVRQQPPPSASRCPEPPAAHAEPQGAGNRSGSEPLSPDRYAVRFTASSELRDKLEHAKNLMSHQNPSLDLAVVVERALDLLITELEKQKLGKTDRPRKARPGKPETVTRQARRAATERNGAQCAWVDEKTGRRCEARTFLEIDHVTPKAMGGPGDDNNTRWLCRGHNKLHAEQTSGRDTVERAIHSRQRKSPIRGTCSKVLDGLKKLGFRATEARAAVEQASSELGSEEASPERVLREALWRLSDANVPSMIGHMAGLKASYRTAAQRGECQRTRSG